MHPVRRAIKQEGAGKLAEREEQLVKERENKLRLQGRRLVSKVSLKETHKIKVKGQTLSQSKE